jgi:hypothetical protein
VLARRTESPDHVSRLIERLQRNDRASPSSLHGGPG